MDIIKHDNNTLLVILSQITVRGSCSAQSHCDVQCTNCTSVQTAQVYFHLLLNISEKRQFSCNVLTCYSTYQSIIGNVICVYGT